jgi:PAS domain S-box-containing protein
VDGCPERIRRTEMPTETQRRTTQHDASPSTAAELDGHLLRVIAGASASAGTTPPSRSTRARERRYRRFLDALGVALYTTDAAGRITFFNEAAATFWGRRPEVGETWCGSFRLYWPDGAPMAHDECPMAVAIREGQPFHGHEAVAERPDGTRVAFVAYPTPLRDDRGEVVGAVNILVDVTARQRVETRLLLAASELETSNSVKDEFLGLVSHELRTPVTTILGNARLLQDRRDQLDAPRRDAMVADIAAESERLHEIIENLLSMTRLGTDTSPELEPTALDRVIQRSVEQIRRRYPHHPVAFSSRPSVIVEADRTYLELLVENLVGNAAKYSPEGSPIEVLVEEVEHEVQVVVLDRGIGLDEQTTADVFEPFFRSEIARSTAGGIGIGLTVCRRIVDLLGGRIWARARDGGGAEIGFALPIMTDVDDMPLRPL